MMKFLAAVLDFLTSALGFISQCKKEKAAASTPERKAEDDKKRFEEALASGDNAVINDSFDQLRKKRDPDNHPG